MSDGADTTPVLSVVDFKDADAMRPVYVHNAHATLDRLIHEAGNDWQRFLHDFTSLNFQGNVVMIGTGRKENRPFCVRVHDPLAAPLKATG